MASFAETMANGAKGLSTFIDFANGNTNSSGLVNTISNITKGAFALNNFRTITGLLKQAGNDRNLAHIKVDKEYDLKGNLATPAFITHIDKSNGFIRPNKYLVEFSPPPALRQYITRNVASPGTNDNYDMTKVGLLCHSVSIPQKTLQTYEHKQLGVAYKVPHSIIFDPVIFTFYADGDMEVRRFFDAWIQCIINDENATMNFYDEYVSQIRISLMDVEGRIRHIVEFYEAFPMSLSNLDLSYASNNSLLSLSVTMSYKRWVEVKK